MNCMVIRADKEIINSNVVKNSIEMMALDKLYKNSLINEEMYLKVKEKIKTKYKKCK